MADRANIIRMRRRLGFPALSSMAEDLPIGAAASWAYPGRTPGNGKLSSGNEPTNLG